MLQKTAKARGQGHFRPVNRIIHLLKRLGRTMLALALEVRGSAHVSVGQEARISNY